MRIIAIAVLAGLLSTLQANATPDYIKKYWDARQPNQQQALPPVQGEGQQH